MNFTYYIYILHFGTRGQYCTFQKIFTFECYCSRNDSKNSVKFLDRNKSKKTRILIEIFLKINLVAIAFCLIDALHTQNQHIFNGCSSILIYHLLEIKFTSDTLTCFLFSLPFTELMLYGKTFSGKGSINL